MRFLKINPALRSNNLLLLCVIAGYILISLLYRPEFHVFIDENYYLETAHSMLEGTLFSKYAIGVTQSARLRYPLGASCFYAPFLALGIKYIFLCNGLLLIICAILFAMILKRVGIPAFYALLLLLNPSMVLFSRTLMSEIPSCFILLLAVLFYVSEKKGPWHILTSFFLLGIAVLVKYSNVLYLIIFSAVYIFRTLKEKRPAYVFVILAALVGISLAALQNKIFFGAWYNAMYTNVIREDSILSFSILNVKKHFLDYFLALNINYPAMVIVCFLYKGRYKPEFLSLVGVYIMFHLLFILGVQGNTFPERCIIGVRYILPVMPLMFLTYAAFLERVRAKLRPKTFVMIFTASILIVLFLDVALIRKHHAVTVTAKEVSEEIYNAVEEKAFVFCSLSAREYINPVFGKKFKVCNRSRADNRAINAISDHPLVYIVYYFKNREFHGQLKKRTWFGDNEPAWREDLALLKEKFELLPVCERYFGKNELLIYKVDKGKR